ncbi:MAG: hypothetical protein M3Y17_00810, partial [Actinomycetota bacterium]|nr:hypothetical protein [Actinomycetota bacterium]
AAALAHTPEAEEVLRGARTRMARKPAALARELLRNFPKARRSKSRRRRKTSGSKRAVQKVTAGGGGEEAVQKVTPGSGGDSEAAVRSVATSGEEKALRSVSERFDQEDDRDDGDARLDPAA